MSGEYVKTKARMEQFGVSFHCARGSHWACYGTAGAPSGRARKPCACTCHQSKQNERPA